SAYNPITISLLNSAGSAVATSTSQYGNVTLWAAYSAPAGGTMYAQVKANSWSGAYTYKLEDVVDDYGNSIATATQVTPSPTVTSALLETSTDLDDVKFSATANHIYKATMTITNSTYGAT